MLGTLFSTINRDYLNIEDEGFDTKARLIKESFASGISEIARHQDFDGRHLFNERGIHWLNRLHTRQELKEFKDQFERTTDNLAITVDLLPV